MDIRRCRLLNKFETRFSVESLEKCYQDVISKLNQKYEPELRQTNFENNLFYLLKSMTKLQVMRSVWIGRRNIDIFIPSIAGIKTDNRKTATMNGLAVEVNGEVHYRQAKMNKDNSKLNLLHVLGIGGTVIENQDTEVAKLIPILKQLRDAKSVDSRAKSRLWRNIYIVTILLNSSKDELKSYFGESNIELVNKLLTTLQGARSGKLQ